MWRVAGVALAREFVVEVTSGLRERGGAPKSLVCGSMCDVVLFCSTVRRPLRRGLSTLFYRSRDKMEGTSGV
jgi:hypothetical protein